MYYLARTKETKRGNMGDVLCLTFPIILFNCIFTSDFQKYDDFDSPVAFEVII